MMSSTKTLPWVLSSVVATLLPLLLISQLPGLDIPVPYWGVSIVLSAAISHFVSLRLINQREALAELNTELLRAHAELSRIAHLDYLTQIPNRGGFFKEMGALHDIETGWILMLDIDHFKSINDTHGHDVGDRVLRNVASVIANSVEAADVFGRLGGEEFGIFLRQGDRARAEAFAEQLRADIADAYVVDQHGKQLCVTVSLGVAKLCGDVSAAMKAADAALYGAKRGGRNRVAAA